MKSHVLLAGAFVLLCTTGCSAATHDFDSVVSGVERHYSVQPEHIPMMGFVSLCARAATLGGVKGMRIAEFDRVGNIDSADLYTLVQSELGTQWQPMVTERSSAGREMSVIFVQPGEGSSMRMLIADYDGGELDVVRMELNGAALARWMRHPGSDVGAFHHGDLHPGRTD